MADQKKWFKVWASIIHDAKFQNIRLEDIGAWTLLGALMCEQGTNGKIQIIPPATITLALFRCETIENLIMTLNRLPNVSITPPSKDNGSFTVIISKWFTYQVDSTGYTRLKRSRYKKREEEKRREATPFLSEKADPKWM